MKTLSKHRALVGALVGLSIGAGASVWYATTYQSGGVTREFRPTIPIVDEVRAPRLIARFQSTMAGLEREPLDRAALTEYAQLCHANGFFEHAAGGYKTLIQLEPGQPRWPHLLASIYAGSGRLDEALPLARRATSLAPDHIAAWLRLGDVLFKTGALSEADAAYKEVLQRDAENAFALFGLARCAMQGERWTAARAQLQRAATAHPNFAPVQHMLATVYERLGNTEAAALALARAQNAKAPGEPDDAWMDELTPYCHDVYRLTVAASMALAARSPQRALVSLERARELAPDDPQVYRILGNTHASLGDLEKSRGHLEKAAALAPTDESAQLDWISVVKRCRDRAGLGEAVAAALARCPQSAGLHHEAGLLHEQENRVDEARHHFEMAWQNEPARPGPAWKLAELNFTCGRNEDGIQTLERVIAALPRDATTHALLVRRGIETADARTGAWLARAADAGLPRDSLEEIRTAYERRFGTLRP